MKRSQLLCILFFGLLFQVSLAQIRTVSEEVKDAKIAGKTFKEVKEIIQVKDRNLKLDKILDPSKVILFDYNSAVFQKEISTTKAAHISLTVPLEKNKIVVVDLVEVPDTFYNYVITTSTKKARAANRSAKHYRGVIRGLDDENVVAMSFFQNEISGIISTSKWGNYNIGKLKGKNSHIVFNDENIQPHTFICESDELREDVKQQNEKKILQGTQAKNMQTCLKIYLETDYEIYKHFNSDIAEVEEYVLALFNEVATIYQNEQMFIEISELFIWDTQDPYSDNGPFSALSDFRSYRTSFNGNIAQLVSYRTNDMTLSARGAARVDKLCTSDAYSASELYPSFEEYPVFSHQVQVVAHEIAHNIGSKHTHNCVWNGDNTQIDDYGGLSHNDIPPQNIPCFEEPGKYDVTPTIMSYYGSRGWGVYPLTNGFGPQPGQLLRDKVAAANCLTLCDGCFENIVEVSINGVDFTYESTYIDPCDEVCFNLKVTNLENVTYNFTNNISILENGLFCVDYYSEITEGYIDIIGTDSCGETYEKRIMVITEDCCSVTPVTNPHVIGYTLHWDALPNASYYIVSSPPYFYYGCEYQAEISIVPIMTQTNSLELPENLRDKIFVWRVTAVCEDGSLSEVSDDACYHRGIGSSGLLVGRADIYPNPNNGIMKIKVDVPYKTDVNLQILNMNGVEVKRVNNQSILNGKTVDFDSKGSLQKGLYFFVFTTNKETLVKKVMIQ